MSIRINDVAPDFTDDNLFRAYALYAARKRPAWHQALVLFHRCQFEQRLPQFPRAFPAELFLELLLRLAPLQRGFAERFLAGVRQAQQIRQA